MPRSATKPHSATQPVNAAQCRSVPLSAALTCTDMHCHAPATLTGGTLGGCPFQPPHPSSAKTRRHLGGISASISAASRLQARCSAGDAAGADETLRAMVAEGCRIEVPAFSTVMNAYVSQRPPQLAAAESLMAEARALGLVADTQMYNLLLKGYASAVPPQPVAAEARLSRDSFFFRRLIPLCALPLPVCM